MSFTLLKLSESISSEYNNKFFLQGVKNKYMEIYFRDQLTRENRFIT